MSTTGEDPEIQKRGIVSIYDATGTLVFADLERGLLQRGNRLVTALPFRFAAQHYCYDDQILIPAMNLLQLTLGKQGRLRFRSHFGKRSLQRLD